MNGMGVDCAVRARFSYSLWPNRAISFIDLRPLRLRPSRLCASVLAHLRRTGNINVANPWYGCLGAVCYHWFLVGDASQCAEHAVRVRQPGLIKSSDWPHVCLYVLKSGLKRLSSFKKARDWPFYLLLLFCWLNGPSRGLACMGSAKRRLWCRERVFVQLPAGLAGRLGRRGCRCAGRHRFPSR